MTLSGRVLVFIFFTLALTNCGKGDHGNDANHTTDKVSEQNQSLIDDTDKIHDEAMAKLGEVRRLRDELSKQLDSAAVEVDEQKLIIKSKIAELDSAYSGMMDFMHNYHPEIDSLNKETYHEYLETQLEKAHTMKRDIVDAVARARE